MSLNNVHTWSIDYLFEKFIRIFFILMLIELVIGGGGRFFEIGPITLRMVFYFLAIPLSFVCIFLKQRVNQNMVYWVLFFAVTLVLGIVVGVLNGNPPDLIIEDVKPILFFLVLPFFSTVIQENKDVDIVIRIIKMSSLFLGIAYILIVIFLFLGIINLVWFYAYVSTFGEIFFRGEGLFFYKGFLYLCVGFFFFMVGSGKYNKLGAFILLIAIILTLTRGFILMTLIVTIFYFLFIYRNKVISLIVFLSLVIGFFAALPFYLESIGDKAESDMVRIYTLDEIVEKTNPFNFFIGDGFGKGVPIRPVHMEVSYMEIFSKQGALGILFWLLLLIYITYKYFSIYKDKERLNYMAPFYLSVLFVYMQSLTNPFINNPIGMSMVLISLSVLETSKKHSIEI